MPPPTGFQPLLSNSSCNFSVKVPISKLCCCQGFHVKTRWMQCGVEPSQPVCTQGGSPRYISGEKAGSLFSMHLHRKYNLFLHACRAKAVHLQCSAVVIQQCKLTLFKGKCIMTPQENSPKYSPPQLTQPFSAGLSERKGACSLASRIYTGV